MTKPLKRPDTLQRLELSSLRRRISAALVRDFTAEHIGHFANYPIWLRIAQASVASAYERHAHAAAKGKRGKE